MQDHAGHRQRLRERYLNYGLDCLQDHEALELLLYYAIPRRNTNEIAHRLLREYGDLAGVLRAGTADLCAVSGVGENSAALVKLCGDLVRRVQLPSRNERVYVGNLAMAIDYLRKLFYGLQVEVLYLLCLDAQCCVRRPVKLSEGVVNATAFSVRQLVEAALRHGAVSVILAHNHPGQSTEASREDVEATRAAVAALQTVQIGVLDHIILCGNQYMSFARSIYGATQEGSEEVLANAYLSRLPLEPGEQAQSEK